MSSEVVDQQQISATTGKQSRVFREHREVSDRHMVRTKTEQMVVAFIDYLPLIADQEE